MSYEKSKSEKSEKDLSNFNFRKHRRTSRFMEREKDALLQRASSLKRAIRSLVEHTEQAVEENSQQLPSAVPSVKISLSTDLDGPDHNKHEHEHELDHDHEHDHEHEYEVKMDNLKVLPTIESGSNSDISSCASQTSSVVTARLANLSPMPDVRRDSAVEDTDLLSLPAPPDFADSRRSSHVHSK